jgi:hypothetical protein
MGVQDDMMGDAKASMGKGVGTLLLVWVIKQYLDAENEFHVNLVRGGYVLSAVLQLLVMLYIKTKVAGLKEDETIVRVKKKENPMDTEEIEVRMPVMEYDEDQVGQKIKQILLGGCVTAFLHFKMNLVLPLAIQMFLAPYGTYESPLFKVHCWTLLDVYLSVEKLRCCFQVLIAFNCVVQLWLCV